MLKATFQLVHSRTLKKAVEIFKERSNEPKEVVAVCDAIIGDNQAVMSVIGLLSDMGEYSLISVSPYPIKAFNELHGLEVA